MPKTKKRQFKQLTYSDRVLISRLKARGVSLTGISARLGVHKSTVSRELKRNAYRIDPRPGIRIRRRHEAMGIDPQIYSDWLPDDSALELHHSDYWCATSAERIAQGRKSRLKQSRKSRISPALSHWIIRKLQKGWSPEQIAGRSKIDGPACVSHEGIYGMIIRDRKAGGHLHESLRWYGKRRKKRVLSKNRRIQASARFIPKRVDIALRPKVVLKRKRLGDLEGDLIVGKDQASFLTTSVDRRSRLVRITRIRAKTRRHVENAFTAQIKSQGRKVYTLTLDNAREFSAHIEIRQRTGVQSYFARPYAAWERGSIENANGLIRSYFPKRTDFRLVTTRRIKQVETLLNNRPRKCLDYRTPLEVHRPKKNYRLTPARYPFTP